MNQSNDAAQAGRAMSERAIRTIEGQQRAAQFLIRLRAGQADPDDLAITLSMMYGAQLRGFCLILAKALKVQHG